MVILCLVQDFVSLKIKHLLRKSLWRRFQYVRAFAFPSRQLTDLIAFPFVVIPFWSLLTTPPAPHRAGLPHRLPALSPPSPPGLKQSGVFLTNLLVGFSCGLTCVTEGLTSALDVGPVPRYSSQGHLRFLLSSLTGKTKDERSAQGLMEPFLQHSFKAAFQVCITPL